MPYGIMVISNKPFTVVVLFEFEIKVIRNNCNEQRHDVTKLDKI